MLTTIGQRSGMPGSDELGMVIFAMENGENHIVRVESLGYHSRVYGISVIPLLMGLSLVRYCRVVDVFSKLEITSIDLLDSVFTTIKTYNDRFDSDQPHYAITMLYMTGCSGCKQYGLHDSHQLVRESEKESWHAISSTRNWSSSARSGGMTRGIIARKRELRATSRPSWNRWSRGGFRIVIP